MHMYKLNAIMSLAVALTGVTLAGCGAAGTADDSSLDEDVVAQAEEDVGEVQQALDTCTDDSQLLCSASTYWSPSFDDDTDSTGTQYNQTINTPISVQMREFGTELQARVCKLDGAFLNDIAFSIYDAATNSGSGVVVANLRTAGLTCSGWLNLNNDTGYLSGQQFGGIWQVVSPATSASGWGFPYSSCSVSGTPGGTCWSGINITMTRTCK